MISYNLNIARTVEKIYANEIRDFIYVNYYKRIGFSEENSYYSMKCLKIKDLPFFANKLIEKVLNPCNAKKNYQTLIRNENRKSVKKSKIIAYKPEAFENPKIFGIKSFVTEHLNVET